MREGKRSSIKKYSYYGTFKPSIQKGIQVLERTDLDVGAVFIINRYKELLQKRREKLESYMIDLYGRPVKFSDKSITSVLQRIDYIIERTDLSMIGVRATFKDYFGEEPDLPLDSEKILKALEGIDQGLPVDQIKQILK